jgi:hypothetical protein
MQRWSSAAVVACGTGCLGLLAALPSPLGDAGASGAATPLGPAPTVRVTPSRGLVGGQSVTVSGRGLTHTSGGAAPTWFVIECTAAVRGRMNPSTDTAHCDVTAARGIRVARNGSFATTYRVITGIVGDGYCGTPAHLTCVLGVASAAGRGTVVRIGFKDPAPAPPPPPGG